MAPVFATKYWKPLYLMGNMLYNEETNIMGGVAMYCMKCGREVEGEQVFCPECLEQMGQEPVSITSSVKIPRQPPRNSKSHRPTIHLEEEVKRLERSNGRLRAWVVLLATASVLLSMAMYHKQVVKAVEDLGKNYSIVESNRYGPR